MAKTDKPKIEIGAMTLVLLVEFYRSQMIALLLKNGVVVGNGTSNQQIVMLMANLLRVSKSFALDLTKFVNNKKVASVIAKAMVKYGKGDGYMNFTSSFGDNPQIPSSIGYQSQFGLDLGSTSVPTATSQTSSEEKGSFWSNLNLGDLLGKGLNAFGQYDKNKTDREIANAYSSIKGGVGGGVVSEAGSVTPSTNKPINTATIVLLSLFGVSLIGAVVYFATKSKE
jgi:hypothetical protein